MTANRDRNDVPLAENICLTDLGRICVGIISALLPHYTLVSSTQISCQVDTAQMCSRRVMFLEWALNSERLWVLGVPFPVLPKPFASVTGPIAR